MIVSAAEFVALRTSKDPADYARAAREPAVAGVWAEIVAKHPDMRIWVAQNKTVPVEILAVLAGDEDDRVRSMVAMKRKLPAEVLERLSTDRSDAVRASVARHRNTPLGVLRELATVDPSDEVRSVAANRLV